MEQVSNWKHRHPKNYFEIAIKLFGNPQFITNKKHGNVRWLKLNEPYNIFTCHMLVDEKIKHSIPTEHYGFFYSTIKFYIPSNKLEDVLAISESIMYDSNKSELTSICDGINSNITNLYIAMMIAMGKYELSSNLVSSDYYKEHIIQVAKNPDKILEQMAILKQINNRKYCKEIVSNSI